MRNSLFFLLTIGSVLTTGTPHSTPVTVTFTCETCTGKGKLFISGKNSSTTRELNSKKDTGPAFPLDLPLEPGDYRLMYWQNKVLQIQSSFIVREGEKMVVKVK